MNANQKHSPSNVGACILVLCALLARFNLAAQPIPSRYSFGLTMPQYVSMSASNTAQGYRPISLDANGPTGGRRNPSRHFSKDRLCVSGH